MTATRSTPPAQMSKNMDPKMMQNMQQQMMANPAMAKQAADQMANMSGTEMKQKLDQVQTATGGVPVPKAPAPAQTVVEKLKASPMDVPADVIEVRGAPRDPDDSCASATAARPAPNSSRAACT